MIDKLNAVEARYEQLMAEMSDPAVQGDAARFRSHSKAPVSYTHLTLPTILLV